MRSQVILRPIEFKTKEFYRILMESEHLPMELDKYHTDKVLEDLLVQIKTLQESLEHLYGYDYEIYKLLMDESYNAMELSDGESWRLNDLADSIKKLADELNSRNNEIASEEESIELEDLGFKLVYIHGKMKIWEKEIEDNDKKTIVEEILIGTEPEHRMRTTIWEKKNYGKSSKSIKYEDLELTPELLIAIENSKNKTKIER